MASNVQDAAARIAALVVEDNDGPTCDVFIPDRDKVRRRVLGEALTDFARAIVDEVRAPAEPSEMAATVLRHEPRIDPAQAREAGAVLERALADDVQCTDEELATALLAARGLASASPTGDGTLIARALLRMRAERRSDSQRLAAYRALLAADYAIMRAFYHAPGGTQDALLDERSRARAAALAEVQRVDREFAERAMMPPEDDPALAPGAVQSYDVGMWQDEASRKIADGALPTVPGMAESDARLRAEMATRRP